MESIMKSAARVRRYCYAEQNLRPSMLKPKQNVAVENILFISRNEPY